MFNPSLHTATNKPVGLIGKPIDARSYYYDQLNFEYRPYTDTNEVLSYLLGSEVRKGQFTIIIMTDNTCEEWWFKDGVSDADLVKKSSYIEPIVIYSNDQRLELDDESTLRLTWDTELQTLFPGTNPPSIKFMQRITENQYKYRADQYPIFTDNGTNIITTDFEMVLGNLTNFKLIISK